MEKVEIIQYCLDMVYAEREKAYKLGYEDGMNGRKKRALDREFVCDFDLPSKTIWRLNSTRRTFSQAYGQGIPLPTKEQVDELLKETRWEYIGKRNGNHVVKVLNSKDEAQEITLPGSPLYLIGMGTDYNKTGTESFDYIAICIRLTIAKKSEPLTIEVIPHYEGGSHHILSVL